MRELSLDLGRVTLVGVEAGPAQGDPVVLLHGFPECWYGWRHQLGPLAEAGHRVVAVDQRGYGASSRPRGVAAYAIDELVADVLALVEHLGGRASVVAHDWGAMVAWWLAVRHPEKVAKLAILNVPHPAVFNRALRTLRQARKSWYAGFFQLPWLPELVLGAGGSATAARLMARAHTRPGAWNDEVAARYREAWNRPGAWTAMINWYRAAVRHPPARPASTRVRVPTLILWGRRDFALGEEMARPSAQRCEECRLVMIDEAGHFVQSDAPERVNAELLAFLAGR